MIVSLIVFFILFLISCGLTIWYYCGSRILLTLLGLDISFFTMIATILVAIIIYLAQEKKYKNDNKSRTKNALAIMYAELDMALDRFALNPLKDVYQGRNIRSAFNTNINELKNSLSEAQFRHLVSVVNYIDFLVEKKGVTNTNEGIVLLVRDWMIEPLSSDYNCYYPFLDDYKQVLNKETFELISALQEKSVKYNENLYELRDAQGAILYRYNRLEKTIQIYNDDKLMIDGTMGLLRNRLHRGDGYKWSQEYDGFYKAGYRNGNGTAYFKKTGKMIAKGIWEKDLLIDGVEYDWVVQFFSGLRIVEFGSETEYLINADDIDKKIKFQFQYKGDVNSKQELLMAVESCEKEQFYVVDLVKKNNNIYYKNVRSPKVFLQKVSGEVSHYSI